jgi:hypothetical protein
LLVVKANRIAVNKGLKLSMNESGHFEACLVNLVKIKASQMEAQALISDESRRKSDVSVNTSPIKQNQLHLDVKQCKVLLKKCDINSTKKSSSPIKIIQISPTETLIDIEFLSQESSKSKQNTTYNLKECRVVLERNKILDAKCIDPVTKKFKLEMLSREDQQFFR